LITGNLPILKQMWGNSSSKLKTDITDWRTNQPLEFSDVTDMKVMLDINEKRSIPLIFDIHGKNDTKVLWSASKIEWYDSLQSNHIGGVFYWDQREHVGDGANFLPEETQPDFFRYAVNKSYPAFSNCSIDQNPGNGTKTNGNPYGALNGYLDWNDASITDNAFDYSITCFVKNMYVGGTPISSQYDS